MKNYNKEINEITRRLENLKLNIQDNENDIHKFNKTTQQINKVKNELYNLNELLKSFN